MPEGYIYWTSIREIEAFVRAVFHIVLMYLPIVETQFQELFGEGDAFDTRIKHKDGTVWFFVYDEEIDEEADDEDYETVLEINTGISSVLFKSLRQTIIDKIMADASMNSRPRDCDTSELPHVNDDDYDTLETSASCCDTNDHTNMILGFFRPYAGEKLAKKTLKKFYNDTWFSDKNERDLFYKLFTTFDIFKICFWETQFNSFDCVDVESYDVTYPY